MYRLSATIRITIGLTLLSSSLLLVFRSLGLGPDEQRVTMQGHQDFCEALAIYSSVMVSGEHFAALEDSLGAVVERYPDIHTVTLRRGDGSIAMLVPGVSPRDDESSQRDTVITVPLVASDGPWGLLEVAYKPLVSSALAALWQSPSLRFALVLSMANGLLFFLYLKRNLQHLDPSRVVPDRVRNALDTIPGGLVILDSRSRILLANKAFSASVDKLPAELQGVSMNRFDWRDEGGAALTTYPWQESVEDERVRVGNALHLFQQDGGTRCYSVHASPIVADDGSCHGALVSLDDVTELESNRLELTRALEVLRRSRDEVRNQNEQLRRLATRDPLTDCLNRRSFYESLESHWKGVHEQGNTLSVIMVDLDHFKSINDNHGHSAGDLVLQKAAAVLRDVARSTDIVCRYGGEEFCVLLPFVPLDQAVQAAERFRRAIADVNVSDIHVTASLGVSSTKFAASSAQEMIDQADKSLYLAKRQGRNQVVHWAEIPDDLEVDGSLVSRTSDDSIATEAVDIPYHAVSALIAALSYRDAGTAEHSRRVADLCVATASGFLSARDCYVLEVAATLHDIGKIGVPDSILLKPGPLTKEEWEVMGEHDTFGVQIIDSAFACPALTEIIENHHAWYSGNPREPNLPTGEAIPLGARILAIADAYDAIVSDRVYRKGRSQEEAFAELRRSGGTQFDRNLVERFIEAIGARYESRVAPLNGLSRQSAVALGQHIGRLAETLDKQDLRGLAALAGRMKQTAEKHQVTDLVELAEQLRQAAKDEDDVAEIAQLTTDLIDLCRSSQSAFLADIDARAAQRPQGAEQAGIS